MIRIYHPYHEWECFKNGMYTHSDGRVDDAVSLLSNPDLFSKTLSIVIREWKKSAEENLTNKSVNRKAWCGQVACCYKHNVSEINTRKAWKKLTDKQRYEANKVATKHIKSYEKRYTELYKRLGKEILPEWDSRRSPNKNKSIKKSPFIQGYLFSDFK